jgi:hypothetical protein
LFFLSNFFLAFIALVGFESEGFEHPWCSCTVSLLLLEGDLLVGLVKRPELLLRGACDVVLELAISEWRKS